MTILLQAAAMFLIGIAVILNRYSLEILHERIDYLEKELQHHVKDHQD